MARELVWLENRNFAAWGCSQCDWIIAGFGSDPDKPSLEVKQAFNIHICAEFSHSTCTREKKSEL
jgi:hypothetical protein